MTKLTRLLPFVLLLLLPQYASAAIAITEPTAEAADTTDGTSYASLAAYTPTANSFQVVIVFAAGTSVATASMTGGSLTWTRQNFVTSGAGSTIYLFTAPVGASPVSTDPTFDCTGDGATGVVMAAWEVTGQDTVTPVVRIATASGASANPVLTWSVALTTTNAYVGAIGVNRQAPAYTQPTSWTQTLDTGHASPGSGMSGAYRATGETGTAYTWTGSSGTWAGIGIEVAVASGGTTTTTLPRLLSSTGVGQ